MQDNRSSLLESRRCPAFHRCVVDLYREHGVHDSSVRTCDLLDTRKWPNRVTHLSYRYGVSTDRCNVHPLKSFIRQCHHIWSVRNRNRNRIADRRFYCGLCHSGCPICDSSYWKSRRLRSSALNRGRRPSNWIKSSNRTIRHTGFSSWYWIPTNRQHLHGFQSLLRRDFARYCGLFNTDRNRTSDCRFHHRERSARSVRDSGYRESRRLRTGNSLRYVIDPLSFLYVLYHANVPQIPLIEALCLHQRGNQVRSENSQDRSSWR